MARQSPLAFWQSLWFKLSLAFLLVSLAAVAVAAAWINRATADNFARFLDTDQMIQLGRVQTALEELYAREGNWDSAGSVLQTMRGTVSGGGAWEVVDAEGEVVAAIGGGAGARGQGRGQGGAIAEGVSPISLPLTAGGREVGRLLVTTPGTTNALLPHVERFLTTTNQAIWIAVTLAALLSVLLGFVLGRFLTRPLTQMTAAARALAGGEPPPPVRTGGEDELGRLAATFNEMSAALQRAEAQRQQLLADTAHELRTPITIMQGHLEAMLDGVFEITPDNLAAVHEETLLLKRLVGDLRTLSLAEMGELPLEKRPVDLKEVIGRAVQAFQPLCEADGVALATDFDGGAWPAVQADAGRILQVLANLIGNALRHVNRPGGSITVAGRPQAGGIEVAVIDDGPGLTPAQQKQVFDRFWKADSSRSRTDGEGGSGLGLAICQAIVQMHDGRIWVESSSGSGAAFIFWLPFSS